MERPMRWSSRGFVWAALVVLLTMLMVSCAPDEGAVDEVAPEPTEGTEAEEEAEAPAPEEAEEDVVLRFVSWQWGQPGYEDFFNLAIAEFEERHPNVTFERIPVSLEEIRDFQLRMLTGGDPPEILHLYFGTSFAFAEGGWLEPLTDRLAQTDFEENWVPYLWEGGLHEGEPHTLYISGAARMLMHNRDMFEAAGIEVPTTPEEFVQAAQDLTGDGQFGVSVANAPDVALAGSALNIYVTALGGGWSTAGQPTANSPEAIQAIETLEELVKSGATPEGVDRIGAREVFWEGRAAMHIEGPWVMTSVKEINPDLLPSVGVAPVPFPHQAGQISNGFAIAKDAQHKDLAWEFIEMISSQEWMQVYLERTGVQAGRTDLETSDALLNEFPWLPEFLEAGEVARSMMPEGLEQFDADINRIVSDEVADVLFGNRGAQEAAEAIQQRMEQELDR